jgi:hypothetical protein
MYSNARLFCKIRHLCNVDYIHFDMHKAHRRRHIPASRQRFQRSGKGVIAALVAAKLQLSQEWRERSLGAAAALVSLAGPEMQEERNRIGSDYGLRSRGEAVERNEGVELLFAVKILGHETYPWSGGWSYQK